MGYEYPLSKPKADDWEQLYTQLSPILYRYGLKICTDPGLVEDCMHDVFVSFFKSPKRNEVQHPQAYLCKSLRHRLIERLKADARHRSLLSDEDHTKFEVAFSPEALRIVEEKDQAQQRALKSALKRLSPRQREAIYLKFYENHSYEEVSDIMQVDKSALYTLIYKSLQQMKKVLHQRKPSQIIIGASLLALLIVALL